MIEYELLQENGFPVLKVKQVHKEPSCNFTKPALVADYIRSILNIHLKAEEYVYMIAVDTKCKPLALFEISHGTVNAAMISPREIYIRALLCGAVGIILVHNHVSGDVEPSYDDMVLTERVHKAGELVGIPLLDHIVVSERVSCSMKENEMGGL